MNNKKGLTLVEVITLIILIALLLAFVPVFKFYLGPRNKSLPLLCKANLKQWGVIFRMYCEDNNGIFSSGMAGSSSREDWLISLEPYYKGEKSFLICPDAKIARSDGNNYEYISDFYRYGRDRQKNNYIELWS